MTKNLNKYLIGSSYIWLSGSCLVFILLALTALIYTILINGLGFFWTSNLALIELKEKKLLGEIVQKVTTEDGKQIKIKVGNKELYGIDFIWVDEEDINNITYPDNAIKIERVEYGNFYGFFENSERQKNYQNFLVKQKKTQEILNKKEIIDKQISQTNQDAQSSKLNIQKLVYNNINENDPKRIEQQNILDELTKKYQELLAKQTSLLNALQEHQTSFVDSNGMVKDIVHSEIIRFIFPNQMKFMDKILLYLTKFWELLTTEPREANTEGGIFPAIFGTVMMVFLMSIFSFPLGIAAAIYLREYAADNLFVKLVRISVNNLAGVPSIVFGIFGVSFFIYGLGSSIDSLFYPERLPTPTFGTGGILWASLTLAILTVPVVIVATEEALSSVPMGLQEASLALGATKLTTLTRIVLPMATPGILTGFILSMARAAGEVAPLMITGVVKLAPNLPIDSQFPYIHLERKFMHLGFHIFDVGFQSPNVEAARPIVYLTTLILVFIVFAMTSIAIILREKLKKRYSIQHI